jgi:hypothetical protein
MISKADIFDIAKSVGIILTDIEIDWVLLSYEDAQRQDPSGTWNLVVEDLCHQAVEFRGEPTEEPDMSRYHTDGDGDDNTLLNFMG